ncbi:MAG: oligosaccharide flippase family protein [Thermostichales cyanobacterium SZTDM-1c_bins_54]
MNRKLLENIAALMLVQGSQYVLPLLSYPYLMRVLGTEGFGVLGYAHTLSFYLIVLVDFGFSLTATRLIAIHRGDPEAVGRVISPILVLKGVLVVLGLGLTVGFAWVAPPFRPYVGVFVGSFLRVVGEGLFPVWYFQGWERMSVITALQILAKTSTLLSLFIWVKSPADLTLAAFLNSSGSLIMALLGLGMMLRDPGWRWQPFDCKDLVGMVRQSLPVAVAALAYTSLNSTHVVILGFFADLTTLGSFILAERIVRALSLIVVPLGNALYPHISRLFQQGRSIALAFLKTWIPRGAVCFALLSALTWLSAESLVLWIGGVANPASVSFLRGLCLLPLLTYGAVAYGHGILLAAGHNHHYSRCYLASGALVLLLSLLWVPMGGVQATVVLMPLGDSLLLGMVIWTTYQLGISPWLGVR